jgi:hypothetical protein
MYANYIGKQTLNFYNTFQPTSEHYTLEMAVPYNRRHNQDTGLAYGNKTLPEQCKVQFKMLNFKIIRMGSFWIAAHNS